MTSEAARFEVLGDLARRTKVIFLTHHAYPMDVAVKALSHVGNFLRL